MYVFQTLSAEGVYLHRYPKLYGRLDRVTFDRNATANYKDLYEKKTFFSSI